ncbi:hypothetical protein O3M35_005003 [Rhynocoris fuscipes]|uniref:CRAL-TRIO domain-containing protein n=1 Tax=Rhynocoris fuscipes TaxID=488301 RepID=A0AAW1DHH6_9HEMI
MVTTDVVKTPTLDELENIIEAVRKLVLEERQLRCSTSDSFLIRFIKASEYDVQKSYQLVKDYFRAKKDYPDVFVFKAPSFYISVFSRLELGFVVPGVDFNGRRIIVLRLGNIDPMRESWTNLMQSATVALESLSLEADVQDRGVNLIFDCTNFSLKIMKWATPHKMHVVMKFLQESIPMRFVMYHIVNAPIIFNIFFRAVKPFMNEEFIRKLNWHYTPFITLHKYIDAALIPKNIGGTLDDNELKTWYEFTLEKEHIFKEYHSMGYT